MGKSEENVVKSEPSEGKLEKVAAKLEPSAEKEEYEALLEFTNPISQPMAPRKLAKKLYKLIKKAVKDKNNLRQGIVDVQRALRKGETGLVILAGNVYPIDIYSHVPAVCEEKGLTYVYTPSKEHLGLAAGHRRCTIVLLIKANEAYKALFDECVEIAGKLPINT